MMRAIETTVVVDEDGTARLCAPPGLRPGEHRAVLVIQEADNGIARTSLDLPVHDSGPWPEDLSLRREDMYDDWGR